MNIIKYCPWCDYNHPSLKTVHQHMDDTHPFLAGVRPSIDTSFDITAWEETE